MGLGLRCMLPIPPCVAAYMLPVCTILAFIMYYRSKLHDVCVNGAYRQDLDCT